MKPGRTILAAACVAAVGVIVGFKAVDRGLAKAAPPVQVDPAPVDRETFDMLLVELKRRSTDQDRTPAERDGWQRTLFLVQEGYRHGRLDCQGDK